MTVDLAQLIVSVATIYVLAGTIFAAYFVTLGARHIDPTAEGMHLQTRLILFPGAVGLWPLLVFKRFTQKEPPLK